MVTKPRGAVAPGKKQVNWRINADDLDILEEEVKEKSFGTVPALVNIILRKHTKEYQRQKNKRGD